MALVRGTRRRYPRRRVLVRPKRAVVRRPRKAAAVPVRQQIATIQRSLRAVTGHDTYEHKGVTNIPQNGIYPWYASLNDPVNWTRIFGLYGTATLEAKDRVLLDSMTLRMKFSLVNATAIHPHKLHVGVISLTRQGKVIFPAGVNTANWALGQTHTTNDNLNQVILNKDLFRVRFWRTFILGAVQDGAANLTSVMSNSVKELTYTCRPKFLLGSNLESWKQMTDGNLPTSRQLYLIVFSGLTTAFGVPYANPLLDWHATYNIRDGN